MLNHHHLKFHHLRYAVSDIKDMIKDNPDIIYFVFSYYLAEAATSIQLIAYARTDVGFGIAPNILDLSGEKALELDIPVILSNNFISVTHIQALIEVEGLEYLFFIPQVNTDGHIYYIIQTDDDATGVKDDPIITNPSPPAKMTT